MALEDLPNVFSFRERLKKSVRVQSTPEQLPPPSVQFDAIPPSMHNHIPAYRPGGRRRPARVKQFIWDDESIIKLTRNCLDDLMVQAPSPWLANGNLSVREAAHSIFDFEKRNVANESTYWLFFELFGVNSSLASQS